MKRYLEPCILQDLAQKMVLVGGPRQVGKTTMALQLIEADSEQDPAYLNYDVMADRELLLQGVLPAKCPFIILDEIHKYAQWRNLIKGFYDKMKSSRQFLITGSAKLDHYSRGGDSLQGRYHYYRLHPLHLDEVSDVQRLLSFGGFPEPYLVADQRQWSRWQNERRRRVTLEDIASLESIKNLNQLDLLASILPARVGSLLSIKNIAQDLSVAHATAERWIEVLEAMYYCYRIRPHHNKALSTTKKERKLYLWDWSLCTDEGARLENFVAGYLLKYCHFRQDYFGEQLSLRFLRDREQREIDFLLVQNNEVICGIECKMNHELKKSRLPFFARKALCNQLYQVHLGSADVVSIDGVIRSMPVSALTEVFPIKFIE